MRQLGSWHRLTRLKARTVSESLQGHPWAVPVLVVATILFFSSYEIQSRL